MAIEGDNRLDQEADVPEYMRPDGKPSSGALYAFVLNPATAAAVPEPMRKIAHQLEQVVPELRDVVQNSRLFVRRSARFMVNNGIDQIIDLGSGLPTDNNTHEVAQDIDPDARVVYVDNDDMTRKQAVDQLGDTAGVRFLAEDVRDPGTILNHPATREIIDFDRPVGLMMASIIHIITEAESQEGAGMSTHELVRTYLDALPSGSYLAFEHATFEGIDPARVEALQTHAHICLRSLADIRAYFDGLDIVRPSVTDDDADRDIVWSNKWRAKKPAQADVSGKWIWAAVGVKP